MAGFTVKQGSLYSGHHYINDVITPTIVEVLQLDYITDSVSFRSTCGTFWGTIAVSSFLNNFKPYVPATIDEGLAYSGLKQYSGPKCQCGINKTYPKEDTTYMHSDWCQLYRMELN